MYFINQVMLHFNKDAADFMRDCVTWLNTRDEHDNTGKDLETLLKEYAHHIYDIDVETRFKSS